MALTDESGTNMVLPVTPMGNTNNGNSGFGWGGDGFWIILLFILLGGWNNGGFGGGFDGGLYPWMNNSQNINNGFRDQMLNTTVNGIQQGVNNLGTQLCNCCGDIQMALANGFSGVEQGANARQIANMQTAFAAQTAQAQGFNNVQAQLAQCCCDNRLATQQLQAVVQQENCADRAAVSDGIRDIIVNNTANTQRILDQLCSDKIDAKNERIADLERQLTMANLQASQVAQTAQIRAGQVAEIDAMYNRLVQCPIPSQPVYGYQPIFTCPNNNNGCGCGCNNNF